MGFRTDTGLGDKIRQERNNELLTQKELAEAAGVDRTTVVNAENGNASISKRTLRNIAHALNLKPKSLIKYHT